MRVFPAFLPVFFLKRGFRGKWKNIAATCAETRTKYILAAYLLAEKCSPLLDETEIFIADIFITFNFAFVSIDGVTERRKREKRTEPERSEV